MLVYPCRYIYTAFTPSDIPYLSKFSGNINLIALWISLDLRVLLFETLSNVIDSVAILSKMSFIKEFMISIAFFEIPKSGCTVFKTL